MAHELCASIVPETWVDEVNLPDGGTEKIVLGVDAIVKDRWNLVCYFLLRSSLLLMFERFSEMFSVY